jgi:hypothetical protein
MQITIVLIGAWTWSVVFRPAVVLAGEPTAACANSGDRGARQYLPECRAYELVTPPYKGGSAVSLITKAISPDGSRLIGTSYGGFAGIENNEQNKAASGAGIYAFERTEGGWRSEALQPPATSVSHASYVAASSDLTSTLWELIEQPPQPETQLLSATTRYTLAMRTREAGSPARYAPVGPEDSPAELQNVENFHFEGASHDLSHIAFGIVAKNSATWPGDTTGSGSSLYEYSGLGNSEPALVGVRNEGALGGSQHLNEGAQLISRCGTYLGGAFFSADYNAISNTGATLFFTAVACSGSPAVNEIYARVDQARTTAISEPAHPLAQGAGEGPEECDAKCQAAPAASAAYQGASESGEEVFFTTQQSLLNGDEAGEGNGVDLYEADLRGGELRRLTQVSHDPNPGEPAEVLGVARISGDGGRVYFVAQGLLAGANAEGRAPTLGGDNLYVYDTVERTTRFVATLAPSDEEDWQQEDRRPVQATGDGRFLIFLSKAPLTGAEDTSTVGQLFEYDAQSERLSRVSIGQRSASGVLCPATGSLETGYNCNGNTSEPAQEPRIPVPIYSGVATPTEGDSTLAISKDGRVFFMSRDALTPLAQEGSKNIYEYSAGDVHLIAPGEDRLLEYGAFQEGFEEHDRLVGTDPSGVDVFFGAIGQLVRADVDTQADVYDARVLGGFSPALAPSECVGGACRVGSVAPELPATPSVWLAPEAASRAAQLAPAAQGSAGVRARKLARALAACRHRPRRDRRACEARARSRYGTKASARNRRLGAKR